MKLYNMGKVVLGGTEFDNPLAGGAVSRRDYGEGKESAKVSFRRLWLSRYVMVGMDVKEYASVELKLLSNGRAFLDGVELKGKDELATVGEIFDGIRVE